MLANENSDVVFRLLGFLRRPTVILKLVCILFSVIVWGCISHGGHEYNICLFNGDEHACSYGIFVALVAFIAANIGISLEILKLKLSNQRDKKLLAIGELAFSGVWTFLWFVGFCYLTNRWSNTPYISTVPYWKYDNLRASLSFSFFSIFSWGGLTFLLFQSFREIMVSPGYFESGDQYENRQQIPEGYTTTPSTYNPYAPYQSAANPTGSDQPSYYQQPIGSNPPDYSAEPTKTSLY
jgi:hypothetical protein